MTFVFVFVFDLPIGVDTPPLLPWTLEHFLLARGRLSWFELAVSKLMKLLIDEV
jgi:hypothetical protein